MKEEKVYEVEIEREDVISGICAIQFMLDMLQGSSMVSELLDVEFIEDLNKALGILLLIDANATGIQPKPRIKKELS